MTGGFDHDLCPDFRPRQLRGISLGEDFDRLAVNADEIVAGEDFALQVAED